MAYHYLSTGVSDPLCSVSASSFSSSSKCRRPLCCRRASRTTIQPLFPRSGRHDVSVRHAIIMLGCRIFESGVVRISSKYQEGTGASIHHDEEVHAALYYAAPFDGDLLFSSPPFSWIHSASLWASRVISTVSCESEINHQFIPTSQWQALFANAPGLFAHAKYCGSLVWPNPLAPPIAYSLRWKIPRKATNRGLHPEVLRHLRRKNRKALAGIPAPQPTSQPLNVCLSLT